MTVYVPNGIIMERWTPTTDGAGFDLPPTLAPLAPFRDDLLVLTGLVHQTAYPLPGEGAGDHARAAACYLTGVHPRKTEGADIRAGVSADQIAARHVGTETQLASLELGCDPSYFLGACDAGYGCAYGNTLSWRTETTPLPVEINPRAVFERMFGDIVGSIGGSGHMAGEFTFPRTVVTDSDGNLYAAETIGGRRNQKFALVSD